LLGIYSHFGWRYSSSRNSTQELIVIRTKWYSI